MRTVSYDGWEWLGAPLAIDLANSLPEVRPGRVVDLLDAPERLQDWLDRQEGRLPALRATPAALAEVRALRDVLHGAFARVAAGEAPGPRAIRAINAAAARSPGAPRLRAGAPRVEWQGAGDALDRALAAVARSAIDVLAGPDAGRLRRCHAPACEMFFLGQAGQEWCSVPCGNRARAARHARRRRSAGS